MRNVIYLLVDSLTGQGRYIGKAVCPYKRLREHLKPTNRSVRTHKNNWLNSLLAQGGTPELVILEECSDVFEMDEAEDFWMSYYKSIGAKLTNSCNGGKGTPGLVHSEASIKLMSESAKARDWSNYVPHNKKENVMVEGIEHRNCSKCKLNKTLDNFSFRKDNGCYQPYCKHCYKLQVRESRIKNPPKKLSDEEFQATYETRRKRTEPISEEQKQSLRQARSKPIVATNIATGEVIQFASALAAKEAGFQNTNVGQAIKLNKQYRGYTWKFAA